MSESTEVKVLSTSPALPAPAPPVVADPTWHGKVATFAVTMPIVDAEGQPVEGTLSLRYKFGVSGFDPASVEWQVIDPAQVAITVPHWGTTYEFLFEVVNE